MFQCGEPNTTLGLQSVSKVSKVSKTPPTITHTFLGSASRIIVDSPSPEMPNHMLISLQFQVPPLLWLRSCSLSIGSRRGIEVRVDSAIILDANAPIPCFGWLLKNNKNRSCVYRTSFTGEGFTFQGLISWSTARFSPHVSYVEWRIVMRGHVCRCLDDTTYYQTTADYWPIRLLGCQASVDHLLHLFACCEITSVSGEHLGREAAFTQLRMF